MSDDSAPSTAGFNIPIPVDVEAVISAYRKAIKEVSGDLDGLQKKAEAQMKSGGVIDSALANEIGALSRARNDLRQDLKTKQAELTRRRVAEEERRKQEKQDAEDEARLHARLHLQGMAMRRLGFSEGPIAEASAYAHQAAHSAITLGTTLKKAGYAKLGAAAKGAGEVVLDGALRIGAIATNPYVLAGAVALGAATQAYRMQTASTMAMGKAASSTAEDFRTLAGGDAFGNMIDAGNASQALRVHQGMGDAAARGRAGMPMGVADAFANLLGFQSGDQIANGEVYRKHAVAMETAKQKFGLDWNENTEGTRRQTKILYEREMSGIGTTFENIWATALGQGDKFRRDKYAKARFEAEQNQAASEDVRRTQDLEIWNNSAKHALDRVHANEQRRWLRDVELDRLQRYNAWSMT